MPVKIGEVHTFPNPECSKAQAVKILEEAAEVFSSIELRKRCIATYLYSCDKCEKKESCQLHKSIVDECADTIMAVCNLLAALGVDDMRESMRECEQRNRERGRM